MSLILEPGMTPPSAAATGAGELIYDVDLETFGPKVIEESMTTPVIVDFWAPWCGPCKTLTPMLEKLVQAAGGAVKLAKINVDENQEIAGQMRVQSIPTVYGFVGGRPVDAFQGAVPESELRRFIDKLASQGGGSPITEALEQAAAALEQGDHATAITVYKQVLDADRGNPDAIAGVLRCQVAADELEEARNVIDQLPDDYKAMPQIASAISAVELAEQGAESGDSGEIAGLLAKVDTTPDDHQARYDLAMAYFTAKKGEEAVDQLLEIVRREREWNENAARQQLLKFFEALGNSHEVTIKGRKKLSSILFA